MGVYLDECQLGIDTEINYPHLLLCIGVTCQLEDGTLIGCHVDSGGAAETANLTELKRLIGTHASRPLNLYMIGNRHENSKNGGRSWFEKAFALGFKGKIWIYDTAAMWTNAGVFARITSKPADPKGMCEISVCTDPGGAAFKVVAGSTVPNLRVQEGVMKPNQPMVYGAPRFVKTGISSAVTLPPPLKNTDFKFISI